MGATRYQKMVRMIDSLKSNGDVVENRILKIEILKVMGSEKRAIDGAITLMKELNMIEDIDEHRTRLK